MHYLILFLFKLLIMFVSRSLGSAIPLTVELILDLSSQVTKVQLISLDCCCYNNFFVVVISGCGDNSNRSN